MVEVALLLRFGGPGLDLDKEIGARKTRDDQKRRGRLNVVAKDRRSGRPVLGQGPRVGEVDRDLDEVLFAHSVRFEAGGNIAKYLFGLRSDATRNIALAIHSDLSGDRQPPDMGLTPRNCTNKNPWKWVEIYPLLAHIQPFGSCPVLAGLTHTGVT